MIEIATIFGQRRMKQCALLHGSVFESTIPTISENGFTFRKIIMWSTCRTKNNGGGDEEFEPGEPEAIRFLERCLEMDPQRRISAREALTHDFLSEESIHAAEEDEIETL